MSYPVIQLSNRHRSPIHQAIVWTYEMIRKLNLIEPWPPQSLSWDGNHLSDRFPLIRAAKPLQTPTRVLVPGAKIFHRWFHKAQLLWFCGDCSRCWGQLANWSTSTETSQTFPGILRRVKFRHDWPWNMWKSSVDSNVPLFGLAVCAARPAFLRNLFQRVFNLVGDWKSQIT